MIPKQIGWTGLFFGYRSAVHPEYPAHKFQWGGVTYVGRPLRRHCHRSIHQLVHVGPGNCSEEGQATATHVPLPESLQSSHELKLHVEFRGGFLLRFVIGDTEFPSATKSGSKSIDLAWPGASGKFGLISYLGEAAVRDCRMLIFKNGANP